MTEARVLDHTAIIALFRGDDQVFRLWQQANDDELTPPRTARCGRPTSWMSYDGTWWNEAFRLSGSTTVSGR